MPQAARLTSTRTTLEDREGVARAQEQEIKRARGAISCAECRRLKLKCDKTIPCASCTRRGCASICPNGSLTTGQGTRFVLADTGRLHSKINDMSDRIRQLEDALSILQSSVSRETHPLLRREFLDIKSSLELHSARTGRTNDPQTSQEEGSDYLDSFGTLAVRDDGAATFFGRSAGSESLLVGEKVESESPLPNTLQPLPPDLARLTTSFPSTPSDIPVADMLQLMEDYLPPWPRAAQLCDLYLEQAPWFFGAVTRRQLVEEILPLYYREAVVPTPPESKPSPPGSSSLSVSPDAFQLSANSKQEPASTSHDLGLMFVVFCFGALTDPALPPAPHNPEAGRYFQLTRAALTLEPVLDRPPSVVTVQALSLMAIYQGLVADENSIESTWALMGLSSRLAQSVGLHRDCARFKLSAGEVQKRRALFWELFITDCFQSLATGRLATFSLPFVDTELPSDPDQTIAEDGSTQPSFPAWKARFGKEIISAIVEGTTRSSAPKYSVILDLDRKIRDMELPKYARDPTPVGTGLGQTMSHFMPINYRELSMLYVHRSYFAQALTDFPLDPMRSPFAPSFLAGYRSACTLLSALREQFEMFPTQIARFWVLWTHAFSAATMLHSVVIRAPTTKTAQAAIGELRSAKNLFDQAERFGGRAVKFAPIVRRLYTKAHNSYANGFQRKDIFTPRGPQDEEHDELSIFSGRTRTVATKASRNTLHRTQSTSRIRKSMSNSSSNAPSPPDSAPRSSNSPTSSDPQGSTSYHQSLDSYGASIHPGLVDQIRAFDGQLDAQINSARDQYAPIASGSHSNPGSDPGEYQVQQQYAPGPYHTYDSPPENGWPVPTSGPSSAHPSSNHQQMIPQIHHTMATPRHQSMALPPDIQQAHSLPMFGGVDSGPIGPTPHEGPQYSGYSVPVPHDEQSYSRIPQHASQLWSAPPETQAMAYSQHVQYDQQLPDPSTTSIHPSQQQQQYQDHHPYNPQPQLHSHHHSNSHHQMPPPSVLPVHSGGYSLQESWTSFVQATQQMPAPTPEHYGHP